MKKKETNSKYTTDELKEAYANKQVFETYVKDINPKYDLICVFADGKEAVIPREEASSIVGDDGLVDCEYCLKKKGKIMQVCIKELKIEDNEIKKIILSRKELELKVRKWMYNNLKVGMRLKGIVRGMTDYAAFVDVGGGVTALLRLEEVSPVRIQKVSDKLKLGQRIQCIVKKYDRDTGKIEVSLRDTVGTFEQLTKRLKEGSIVDGIVRGRIKNGIFIEIGDNLMAMSEHVSGIEYGQKVLVYIKKIVPEKEKIKVEIIG